MKEVYKETYRKGAAMVSKHLLPERMPYMAESYVVDAIEVRSAGELDDGREFQDVRVYARRVTPRMDSPRKEEP